MGRGDSTTQAVNSAVDTALNDPAAALLFGGLVGIVLATVISFAARELSATRDAGRLERRLKEDRLRGLRMSEVGQLRDWCLGYLRACLAWRSGDSASYLSWANSDSHHPRARLNLLAHAPLIDSFIELATKLRGGQFGSWFTPELLVRYGRLQVSVLSVLSDQERRILADEELVEAEPWTTAQLESRIAELASLVPPKPPSENRQTILLSVAVGFFAIAIGLIGRMWRRMWTS